ncbi:hypothetical protein H4582DRAFT_154222 [Lactarius indigo]|nr:hypothetical protein H4582DRAFT_154222 [Lactarius indigo]
MDGFSHSRCVLAAFSSFSGAYRSLFKSEHHQRRSPPEARASALSPPLYPHSDTRLAIGQYLADGSTRRRRISGLNSRFDRMLWEASLTTRTFKSLPRRHKHAHSSSSSSTSNRELATASTRASKDMELGSGDLGTHFVVVTEEFQSYKTLPQIGAGLKHLTL